MQADQRTQGGIESRLLDARGQFLGYIRKRIDDPELAEDILQDGLLRAVRAAPELRDEERLIPWFYRVLQNAIVDAYRRRSAEQARIVVADVPEVAAEPEDDAELCACFERLIPTLKTEYADLIRALELGGSRRGLPPNAWGSRPIISRYGGTARGRHCGRGSRRPAGPAPTTAAWIAPVAATDG
jgi:RNA polymerase sigma factor (sigma-70 family)